MEDLPLDRIAALVPEFEVRDLPLGRTMMMMMMMMMNSGKWGPSRHLPLKNNVYNVSGMIDEVKTNMFFI